MSSLFSLLWTGRHAPEPEAALHPLPRHYPGWFPASSVMEPSDCFEVLYDNLVFESSQFPVRLRLFHAVQVPSHREDMPVGGHAVLFEMLRCGDVDGPSPGSSVAHASVSSVTTPPSPAVGVDVRLMMRPTGSRGAGVGVGSSVSESAVVR